MTRAWRASLVTLAMLVGGIGVAPFLSTPPAQADHAYYDPSAVEGSIYRLYRAYFLRDPDLVGFDYWYLRVAKGTSLDEVSGLFASSSEFRTRYGSLDERHFVELIYQNVLGRAADQAGRAYWVSQLDAGVSRGRVMRYFSESAEYQRETATGVPSGWRAGANAERLLATLTVASESSRSGYSDDLFTYPADEDRDGCNTRCEVLADERRSDGTWFSWWDAKLVSVSGFLSIDHVVSLGEAWDSGASHWDAAKRKGFANWEDNLLAVGRTVAASKGDKDATQWTPPRTRSNCLFAEITVTTKAHWRLSVDPAEKAKLSSLLDGCTRTTSAPPAVTGPARPRPKVLMYGDSLSMETEKFFSWFVYQHGYEAVTVPWGGTAPCDWFSAMRQQRDELHPAAVIMQFSGAALTPCMQHRDIQDAYRADTRTAIKIFKAADVPVVWVSTPLPSGADREAAQKVFNQIEHDAAVELGQTYVDAGASVLKDGHFSHTLPCLGFETKADGCSNGRIVVRAPDGGHLCPSPTNFPCPVYSSGALRYGNAQSEAILRRLGAERSVIDKPR